jgi:hypothetical protein
MHLPERIARRCHNGAGSIVMEGRADVQLIGREKNNA